MSDVPEEVVADILARLPVEPLLRFRCVSKPWRALIDSPIFIKLNLNRSIETNSNRSIFLKSDVICSIDFDQLDNDIEFNIPINSNGHRLDMVGSCNGLFCLHDQIKDYYLLWNPSIRKYQKLPLTEIEFTLVKNTNIGYEFMFYGFGYDYVNDDYKVVRVTQIFDDPDNNLCGSEVKVYSMKSNTWRRIGEFPYDFAYVHCNGVLASGALHWVMSTEPEPDIRSEIVAFDIGTEKYWLVPQPEYTDKDFIMSVGVLGGCLCVLCNFRFLKDDIWVMKNYGVKESWTKLISVAQRRSGFGFVTPLAYSKNGDQILLHKRRILVWYDLKSETIMNVRNMPEDVESNVYLGSLVQLAGGGGGETDRKQRAQWKRKNKKTLKKRSTVNLN